MDHSPSWETDGLSATQEMFCLVWHRKFRNNVHNRWSADPILSLETPVHILNPQVIKINFMKEECNVLLLLI
jgi:hypothetical protein